MAAATSGTRPRSTTGGSSGTRTPKPSTTDTLTERAQQIVARLKAINTQKTRLADEEATLLEEINEIPERYRPSDASTVLSTNRPRKAPGSNNTGARTSKLRSAASATNSFAQRFGGWFLLIWAVIGLAIGAVVGYLVFLTANFLQGGPTFISFVLLIVAVLAGGAIAYGIAKPKTEPANNP